MPPVSNEIRDAILAAARYILGPDFRVRLVDPDPLSPDYDEIGLIAIVKYYRFSHRLDITRSFLRDMALSPDLLGKYIGRTARQELIDAHRASRSFTNRLEDLELIAEAAVEICDGHYDDFEGIIKLPCSSVKIEKDKLRKLARCLSLAGYEWMTLT